jgi:hypothetical protein
MSFQIGDHVNCIFRRGKDYGNVGHVSVVQAHNFKIKVLFEDGTDSKLQAASNFEHCDGKRKRGEGDEDDNKEGDEMEEDEKEDNIPPLIDSDEEDEDCDQLTVARSRKRKSREARTEDNNDNNNNNNNDINNNKYFLAKYLTKYNKK